MNFITQNYLCVHKLLGVTKKKKKKEKNRNCKKGIVIVEFHQLHGTRFVIKELAAG